MSDQGSKGKGPKEKTYKFSVDGDKYETSNSSLTGAQIKALIPNFDSTYQLVQEGRGNDPDSVIDDNVTVDLSVSPRLSFYTVPPATFGR